jgi:hypothetical protein
MLALGGKILLTIPFGEVAIIRPLHRVYDRPRLDRLVSPLKPDIARCYRKGDDGIWRACQEAEAACVRPTESIYALAFLMLARD